MNSNAILMLNQLYTQNNLSKWFILSPAAPVVTIEPTIFKIYLSSKAYITQINAKWSFKNFIYFNLHKKN